MTETRRIRKVVASRPTLEGAGVHLHRAIGFGDPRLCDPFLLLDDFRSDVPEEYLAGFPWHPHRGIETITYVLRGEVEHGDSLGNSGVISSGDVQWMTAGSGIIHQEMPRGDGEGSMHGFQLWANLPAKDKMMDPRYRDVTRATIPQASLPGGTTIQVVAGAVDGVRGPVRDVVTNPEVLDVSVPPATTFTHRTVRGHTVFAYVIGGRAVFCDQSNPYSYPAEWVAYSGAERTPFVEDRHLVVFDDGDAVSVTTQQDPVRFLLVSGRPIGEPIAWYGPIVMNTQEELRTAYEDLRRGTFLRTTHER